MMNEPMIRPEWRTEATRAEQARSTKSNEVDQKFADLGRFFNHLLKQVRAVTVRR
jgi:hypothetical protein